MRFIVSLAILAIANCQNLENVFSWKELEFNFPNESVRHAYVAAGDYIPKNNLPIGMGIWKEKMFLTVPRWKKGVASNLNYVSMKDVNKVKSPKLTPYPNMETNDIHNFADNVIINVFRFKIDICDRMWLIDAGIENILGDAQEVRPARLIVIDLNTDKIIRSYTLKDSDKKHESFFANIAIDVEKDNCENAFAYITDFAGYGLVVYSWAVNDSWRVNHNYFYFDPLNGDYNVSGINFHWTDGIFGVDVAKEIDGSKTVYFHAMSGVTEFSVPTKVLQNETLATTNNYQYFNVVGDKGPLSQGPTIAIDENNIAYFGQINRHGVACWDVKSTLNSSSFRLILEDKNRLIFPNDLVLHSGKIYILSSNVPKFQNGDLNEHEDNYFVTSASLESLRKVCKKK